MSADAVKWLGGCRSAPDDAGGNHECMRDERRCVYCGETIEAFPCNGCGRFLTVAEMRDGDGSRCGDCV